MYIIHSRKNRNENKISTKSSCSIPTIFSENYLWYVFFTIN